MTPAAPAPSTTDAAKAGCASVADRATRDALAAAQLDGVHLAGRTIAHLVNNDLALTVGALDLLRAHNDLPPHLHGLLDEALTGLYAATNHVQRVRRVTRVVVLDSPAGPSLDLDRST